MHLHGPMLVVIIFLLAAVGSVTLFRMLRLSPVLGYLLAGLIIGPYGMQIIEPSESTATFAEFGIIFLLFMIGLELSIDRLKAMRRHVFEFGSLQVLLCSAVIGIAAYYWGLGVNQAIVVGGALALSSTAVVLQVLAERNQKFTQVGRLSLATLILQDLAVIPLLVMLQVFSTEGADIGEAFMDASVKAVIAVVVMVVVGRIIVRPLFRFFASLRDDELVTGASLLIVLLAAAASVKAGLSPAMGAFLAGLLIAETEYKPQVEADIQPYKGLFMGLFFMTVGMSLDWRLVIDHFMLITMLIIGLLASKSVIIYSMSRVYGFSKGASLHAGLLLSQGGEFAFIVFGIGMASGFLDPSYGSILLVVITVTMALTPLLAVMGERLHRYLENASQLSLKHVQSDSLDLSSHVIICGYGRVGHTVARLLEAEEIDHVALEVNPDIVRKEASKGVTVHYGDATRKLVLQAVGLDHAKAVIITHADPAMAGKTILAIRALRKDIPIIVRAKNLQQVEWLERLGANVAVAEMYETSLQLGGSLLKYAGVDDGEISRVIQTFRDGDYALTRAAESGDWQADERN